MLCRLRRADFSRLIYTGEVPGKGSYMKALKIIDVSEHNGRINWEQTKNHIDGAIIRCGYGMDQTDQDDKYWKRNADECTRLGIPFGVYLYSYADTDAKSRSEAAHVLRCIKGYKLSYPVYYDLEEEKEGTRRQAVRGAKIFGDIIESAGYWCGIYANENWFRNIIGSSLDKYTKWVAKYSSQAPNVPNVDIWQYTSSGSVPGLTGNGGRVDVNHCYRDFVKEIKGGKPSPAPTPGLPAPKPQDTKKELIRIGQENANNFVGAGLVCDGIRGALTVRAAVMVLQTALNMDHGAGLNVDGKMGAKTLQALGSHYVRKGETQYMVTAAEIMSYLMGYDAGGVECPGTFGNGLEKAINAFKQANGMPANGECCRATFIALAS